MPDPAAVFAALGDPARLALVRSLVEGPQRSSALAERAGLTRPTASKHLRVLHEAGLVEVALDPDDHRARRYALSEGGFQEAQAFLAEVEVFWEGQLQAFKAFAEDR